MRDQQGFTLLELIMSMTIIGILSLIISNFYGARLSDYARNFTLTILQSNTKQAEDSVSSGIRAARFIEDHNTIADSTKPNGDPLGWTSTSGSNATLVLAVPAQDSSGNLIYTDPTTHDVPYLNEVIYYVDTSTSILYRRTLANTNAPGNAATTTGCSGCPADGKVVEDVANMTITFYDTTGVAVSTPGNVNSLDLTLQQSRSSFGHTYTNTLTSRVTLRNKP